MELGKIQHIANVVDMGNIENIIGQAVETATEVTNKETVKA